LNPNELLEDIKEKFGDNILSYKIDFKRLYVKVNYESVYDFAKYLRDNGFDMPITMGATDFPKKKSIEIFYGIWSSKNDFVILFKFDINRDEPRFKTLTDIWPGVQKFERETWELMGVNIEGHPKLKPLLLPEDWDYEKEGYPLRKDFNIKRYMSPWGDESK